MNEIVTGVIGAVAACLAVKGVEWISWKYRERSVDTWKGEWIATLPPFGDRPLRRDKWLFQQRGHIVKAQILREDPPGERGHRWEFVGQERESELFGAYENKDPNSQSYGGIMLKHTELGKYEGYYLRLQEGKIIQEPIQLQRKGA